MGKRTHRWTPPRTEPTGRQWLTSADEPFSIPRCLWPDCDGMVLGYERTKLCSRHVGYMRDLLAAYDDENAQQRNAQLELIQAEQDDLVEQIESGVRIEDPHNQRFLPGWVYYVELDGLIKIGFSKDVKKRMRQYAPTATLLAAEPGTRNIEHQRHQHFAACLARGREWFRDTPELREWINTVATEYGPVHHMVHKWTGPDSPPVVAGKRQNRRP